jgi:FKBP-type peptidyl-prolyl cis-trans isomerase
MIIESFMRFNWFYAILLAGMALLCSCRQQKSETSEQATKPDRESLLKINKNLVKTEDQQIEDFINRYSWSMEETGTGLRYMIYREGNGMKAEKGKVAEVSFTVSLLNGEVCYSSAEDGPKSFLIGKGGVESGLEEGILLLREGDRVKFIIPSHLAFGLLGDLNKIPAKAVLVYDIELLKIN